MPVCTFSTRTWPSQVSTSTSITCTELGTPAPTAILEKRRIIQPKIVPMKPASFSGERIPGSIGLSSSGLSAETLRSGEGGEQLAPRRVGAGDRRPLGIAFDRGLELLHRQQRRRDHGRRDPAAARTRSFRQIGIADPDLDVVRLKSEFVRHRVGDHGAAALADVLRRGARDDASVLDRQFDLRAGLPEIKPVSGRDADAAAIAAGLRRRRLHAAPDIKTGVPNRTGAGDWDWDPSVCAARSDRSSSAARLRRSPVPARTPSAARRGRGRARRAAGC